MTSVKSVVGVIGALLPVAYCGGLLYYFTQNNTLEGPVGQGLGPTVLGLGAIGLLFCAPVIFKLLKLFAPAKPEPGKVRDAVDEDEGSGFDADAALARYMARKAAAGGEIPAAAAPVSFDAPAPRPSFGRKTV
jgi:hypothetical protein